LRLVDAIANGHGDPSILDPDRLPWMPNERGYPKSCRTNRGGNSRPPKCLTRRSRLPTFPQTAFRVYGFPGL